MTVARAVQEQVSQTEMSALRALCEDLVVAVEQFHSTTDQAIEAVKMQITEQTKYYQYELININMFYHYS